MVQGLGMHDATEKPVTAAAASEVIAGVADHAELSARRVRELFAESEFARVVGAVVAGAIHNPDGRLSSFLCNRLWLGSS